MTSKYFAAILLLLPYSAQTMHVQDLLAEITVGKETQSLYTLLRESHFNYPGDKYDNFGKTRVYHYCEASNTCVPIGRVKEMPLYIVEQGAKGLLYQYPNTEPLKSIDTTTLKRTTRSGGFVGSIIATDQKFPILPEKELAQWHQKNAKRLGNVLKATIIEDLTLEEQGKKDLPVPFVAAALRPTAPDTLVATLLGAMVNAANNAITIEDDFVMCIAAMRMTYDNALSKEDAELQVRRTWKKHESIRRNFEKNDIVGKSQSITTICGNDSTEDAFVASVVPYMLIFNKRGLSQEGCKNVAHQLWKKDAGLRKAYTEHLAATISTPLTTTTTTIAPISTTSACSSSSATVTSPVLPNVTTSMTLPCTIASCSSTTSVNTITVAADAMNIHDDSIADDFLMLMGPIVQILGTIGTKYISKEETEAVSKDEYKAEMLELTQYSCSKAEYFELCSKEYKEDFKAYILQLLKLLDKSEYQKFMEKRNDYFSIKILELPSNTPSLDNDPIEGEFVTDVVPRMMLFNKRGLSKEDCEVIAHQMWRGCDGMFRKVYTEEYFTTAKATAASCSIANPVSSATTSTPSICTTDSTLSQQQEIQADLQDDGKELLDDWKESVDPVVPVAFVAPITSIIPVILPQETQADLHDDEKKLLDDGKEQGHSNVINSKSTSQRYNKKQKKNYYVKKT